MPATSQAQVGFMKMVEAYKAGTLKKPKGMSPARWRQLRRRIARAAKGMTKEQVGHYSRTPKAGLPAKAPQR